ncbi:lachesin [Anabrus simplex]|uniref:lachesin n=1 Tax=Anabrus simplex TaxID=316456 RepID=UPI0035A38E89
MVVFSDELRFCLARSDHRNRVRRRTGERGSPDLFVESHTGPTPSIMVWGAIGFNLKSQLVLVEGTMTARHNLISNLREYFYSRADTSCLHQAVCRADINYTPLNLSSLEMPVPTPPTKEMNVATWKQKPPHGKNPHELDQPHIENPHASLTYSGLLLETEGFVLAIQDVPKFGALISNVTASVGREATLSCVVEDLLTYKVAWLRVDTQTILTIATHVITKNHRIGVTHSDHRTWFLHVRDVRESDRGWYMCQINTDPMKSQTGYLEVVVPPDILDYPTSTDMVVREGTNVTLRCAATGSPTPNVTWRREDGESIPFGNGMEVSSVEGPVFNITRVNRLHMGAYLCIASNGVPPSISKRIMLIVHFPPMIWIQNQLVGAHEGQQMTLECHSEAYPKSINYWTREHGEIIAQGGKYEPVLLDNAYKVHMKLTIRSVGPNDFGSYKCVSKNSLGETDGSIKLYRIPAPSTPYRAVATTTEYSISTERKPKDHLKDVDRFDSVNPQENEIMDHSDPEKVTRERTGAADLKLRGRPNSNTRSSLATTLTSAMLPQLLFVAAVFVSYH